MNMIGSLGRYCIYTVLLFSVIACTPSDRTTINHVVLVWLKADTTPAEIDTIIAESQKLTSIDTIESLSIGTAIPSERKIVDDSFSFGMHMRFATQQDMQRYLSHPQHIKFVDTFVKPKLDKLLVYDF
jgi:hypothetical protein